ncbi:dihydrofolate reductase [Phlyctema vagabunda]|uniref:Dihydrofolate reductase n=1 Tax=Phlyctema vagabunda TaxID=108571 RepID=A0ABR4PNX7_9HELO
MAYFAKVTKEKPNENSGDNAVIMGRKTWESIPEKFRPLKGRTNVAISRSYVTSSSAPRDAKSVVECDSLEAALNSPGISTSRKLFVIGGAQIYAAALERPETTRILLTRILSEFECDTFFPISLGEDGKSPNWERKSPANLKSWAGCDVASGIQEENGIKYIFEMWEKI